MLDPIFNVSVPRAQHRRHRLIPNTQARKVVVVSDVYPVQEVHRAIPEICDTYVRAGNVDLLCIEGAMGAIPWPQHGEVLANLERRYPGLSTATRNILLMPLSNVQVVGVDAPELQTHARDAMSALEAKAGAREKFRLEAREALVRAQVLHYPSKLSELRRATLRVYGEDVPLARRVQLCQDLLGAVGVATEEFPQIAGMAVALGSERKLNFSRVEAARNKLVHHMVHRLHQVLSRGSPGDAAYDRLFQFGRNLLGIGPVELESALELRGRVVVNSELEQMMTNRLVKEALRFRSGDRTHSAFYEEMVSLAEAVGANEGDLNAVREYVDYVQIAQADIVPEALMRQERAIPRFIVGRLRQPATELFLVEEQLDESYDAASMALIPSRAEAVSYAESDVRGCLTQLGELATVGISHATAADLLNTLASAKTFYSACLERSRQMAVASLRAMTSVRSHRVMIIAGGFHTDAITRALDDLGDISWSLIHPKFTLPPSS